MPRGTYVPCTEPACPHLRPRNGDCPEGHGAKKRKATQRRTDAQRPSAAARGYGTVHRTRFRDPVLRRDPICVLCNNAPSKHADHHPISRRDLVTRGLDPNDPANGRGLCASCHSSETSKHDGGYGNARPRNAPDAD